MVMVNDFLSLFQTDFYREVWRLISSTWPVWLPLILLRFLISTWITYKRREWLKKTGSILLEIRIPKNTEKSPAAMEMVIEGIWEDVIGTLTDVYLEGAVRDVEDYAVKVIFDPEKTNVRGITTRLVKPDAYPIKTYIDFELDKGNKE